MAIRSGSSTALASHQPRQVALPSLQLLAPIAGLSKHASSPDAFCLAYQIRLWHRPCYQPKRPSTFAGMARPG